MDLSTILSIIGVLLAILSLFVSPEWIKSAINRTILSNRQKRIDSLKEDFDVRKIFKEDNDAWTAALIASVSSALAQLTLFVFWIGANIVTLIRKPELDMIISFNGFFTFYFLFFTLDKFRW